MTFITNICILVNMCIGLISSFCGALSYLTNLIFFQNMLCCLMDNVRMYAAYDFFVITNNHTNTPIDETKCVTIPFLMDTLISFLIL